MAGSIGKISAYSVSFQRFGQTCYALSKAMWGDVIVDSGYSLPQYDAWINGFVNYNAGIGCTYGFMIPSDITFYKNSGNFEISVTSGNQLCRICGGGTGLFSYNNTWNQNTLTSTEGSLAQEKYYLDIYATMQKEYPNFRFLIHDDDKLQKYLLVLEDSKGELNVRKLDLTNKTNEAYLSYTNFNLLALIDYAQINYPLLSNQINDLQEIVRNNQNINVIDANKIIYDNDIFVQNYLKK